VYKEGQLFNSYIMILYNSSGQELGAISGLELSFLNEKNR